MLEIGCGIGRMTRMLAEQAGSVLALDVSPEMVERARAYNPGLANVDWVVSDGRSLDGIDQATVDCCLSYVVFQHIPDPEVTLGYVREIGRVLKPGGWAALQVSDLSPRSPLHVPPGGDARPAEGAPTLRLGTPSRLARLHGHPVEASGFSRGCRFEHRASRRRRDPVLLRLVAARRLTRYPRRIDSPGSST